MSRSIRRLLLRLVCACPLVLSSMHAVARNAPAALSIAYAEQAVRLARSGALFSAGAGAALQANDMLEAGAGATQLDAAGSTIAIGPGTRLFIKSPSELVLLQGWVKLRGAADKGTRLTTANLQFDGSGATTTVHAAAALSELFVESGALTVAEIDGGKIGKSVKLAREQYGARSGAEPFKSIAPPPKPFMATMPRAFMDALVTLANKAPAVAPKREREVTFEELAPWLASQPALRQQLQRRMQPPVKPVKMPTPAPASPPSLY